MGKCRLMARILLLSVLSGNSGFSILAQTSHNTNISGKITDAKTGQALPFVNIVLDNTTIGTTSDQNGTYQLSTTTTSYKISFSFMGYETETRLIHPGQRQVINVSMNPSTVNLREISVKPEKVPYHNKNNPAVELIDKVIRQKEQNRMKDFDFYSCNKYERIAFSLSSLPKDFKWPGEFKQFRPLFDNVDTTGIGGKKNIPFFIRESDADLYYRENPKANKEIVRAEKTIHIDKYVDNKGLTANINYLYQDIDIYANNILFLSNKFLSPVATSAPMFYRYFIIDTTMMDKVKCIQLFFEPRNKADFLFHGFLYITADTSCAISKIDMSFNKAINIDWVKDVRIVQNFDKIQNKAWVLAKQDIAVDFGVARDLPGVYGQREVAYRNFTINQPIADTVFRGPMKEYRLTEVSDSGEYWNSVRGTPLPEAQKKLYTIVDSIQTVPAFRHRMDLIMLIGSGFLNLGKVEFGPVGSFYSFNPVEGSRVKAGGRTTTGLSRWFYLDGYLAYGSLDEQYKYNLGLSYSLSGKTIYKFPVKRITISTHYDTEIPGGELEYASQDNLLYSFKRGVNDKMLYNRSYKFDYLNEFQNHFSWDLNFSYTELKPGGNLHFDTTKYQPAIYSDKSITTPEFSVTLRYAPNEQVYQGKLYRTRVASKYPVFQLNSTFGSTSLLNDYNYLKLKASINKRFYFSIFGFSDVTLEAGKLFGRVPYPLLFIHNANQTYVYQKDSYNMINFLEFVSDHYVSLNIDHSFNGFIFNKIPLLKKLKLREVATFKMLSGGLYQVNDPLYHPALFRFPHDTTGAPTTFSLGRQPYIEGSVGISNILRVFRIDLIKRFTYLNNPHVSTLGVRVQFRIDI